MPEWRDATDLAQLARQPGAAVGVCDAQGPVLTVLSRSEAPGPRAATAARMTLLSSLPPRRAVAVSLALGLFALPALAAAAPIALVGNYPQRKQADGSASTRQPRNDDDYAGSAGIDRADCESDETWQWAFALPTAGFNSLQIWASDDDGSCADPQNRPGGASPRCFRVASYDYAKVANGGVASLRSTDVVKAAYRRLGDDDTTTTTKKAICEPTADMQPTRVFLHFMLFDAAGNVVGSTTSNEYESIFQTTYDLRGPEGPSSVIAKGGALIIDLSWTPPATPAKDLVGYKVYCVPSRSGSACPGVAGNTLPTSDDDRYSCGTGGATGATIQGLEVNQPYEIRVAAYDRYGNTGPYAPSVCSSITGPKDYVDSGLAAEGGGGCALGAGGVANGAGAFGVVAGLMALGGLARRRAARSRLR
jgi:hypothetical protein